MTTETGRGTGRHGTPACLPPRWAASSRGESARANCASRPLHLANMPVLLTQSSFQWITLVVTLSFRRFLLPEYLPYAGIFHERGQPGLATHSSVNRVLAGKHSRFRTSRIEMYLDSISLLAPCPLLLSGLNVRPVNSHCSDLLRRVYRGRSVCGRQQHRQHHLPAAVVGLHQV